MKQLDKEQIFKQIVEKLEENLKVLVESAFEAKEASTNEESKAENKYDTRGLEASYLASGQAKRAQDLQEQIYQLKKVNMRSFNEEEPINVGALVQLLIDDEKIKWLFLLPIGGVEIDFANTKIQTLTIEAPLGQCLRGQSVGDEVEMNQVFYEIQSVQ